MSQEQLLQSILQTVNTIRDDVSENKEHLKTLNGKVAKHNEWINRYDIRVAEEIPKNITDVAEKFEKVDQGISAINKKIWFFMGGVAVVNMLGLGTIIKFIVFK